MLKEASRVYRRSSKRSIRDKPSRLYSFRPSTSACSFFASSSSASTNLPVSFTSSPRRSYRTTVGMLLTFHFVLHTFWGFFHLRQISIAAFAYDICKTYTSFNPTWTNPTSGASALSKADFMAGSAARTSGHQGTCEAGSMDERKARKKGLSDAGSSCADAGRVKGS